MDVVGSHSSDEGVALPLLHPYVLKVSHLLYLFFFDLLTKNVLNTDL
jgi:hypothetical protein